MRQLGHAFDTPYVFSCSTHAMWKVWVHGRVMVLDESGSRQMGQSSSSAAAPGGGGGGAASSSFSLKSNAFATLRSSGVQQCGRWYFQCTVWHILVQYQVMPHRLQDRCKGWPGTLPSGCSQWAQAFSGAGSFIFFFLSSPGF